MKYMAAAGFVSVGTEAAAAEENQTDADLSSRLNDLVPVPVEVEASSADHHLTSDSTIAIQSPEARSVAEHIAGILRPATGYELPIVEGAPRGPAGGIWLRLRGAPDDVGEEGYRLQTNPHAVHIRANDPAGLFNGVQTLRQLLPPRVESDAKQSGPWTVPGCEIVDYPRFEHRGAMLDVAREFYPVEDVKRFIDQISMYKINRLHLHLTDDTGWRIMIESWPRLATYGGQTDHEGGEGGYYTQAEYREIVEYAQARNVMVIPEIDVPGHTGAALASYDDPDHDRMLACEGDDWEVRDYNHHSALCVDRETTYEFMDDVIREVAEMTPGPYIHLGGDEAAELSAEEYEKFFDRVLPMVEKYGKRAIGWQKNGGILEVDPPSSTVAQYYGNSHQSSAVATATQEGHEIILSPNGRTYLPRRYRENTPPETGVSRIPTPVKESYGWDPGSYVDDVSESAVLGPEAALWGETLDTYDDVEILTFPRLPGIAELGWSRESATTWEEYERRLAAQGPRWDFRRINYYRSPQVAWDAQKAIVVEDITADPVLFGGTTNEVTVTVANRSNRATSLSVSLDVPDGWETSTTSQKVSAKDTATVRIDTVPSSSVDLSTTELTATVVGSSNYWTFSYETESVTVLPAGVSSPYKTAELDDPIAGHAEFDFSQYGPSGEKFSIFGGGWTQWEDVNEFGTIYRDDAFESPSSVTVQVTSQDNTHEWARAGIVTRNDLTQNGSLGYVRVGVTPGHGCDLTWDANGDGNMASIEFDEGVDVPVYLRLTRSGTSFTGAYSEDGNDWTELGTVTLENATPAMAVGMCYTALNQGNDAIRGMATFEDFSISRGILLNDIVADPALDDLIGEPVVIGGVSNELGVTVANGTRESATVTVSIEAPDGWDTSPTTVEVAADETTTVGVPVVPPSSDDRSSATLSASVEPSGDKEVFGQAAQQVEVMPAGSPYRPLSTLIQYKDYGPIKMVDGSSSTYHWARAFEDNPRIPVGNYVGVDLQEETDLDSVHVRMGKEGSLHDYILEGELEISSNGNDWKSLGRLSNQPEIQMDIPDSTRARYVRLRVAKEQSRWVVVRDFSVNGQ